MTLPDYWFSGHVVLGISMMSLGANCAPTAEWGCWCTLFLALELSAYATAEAMVVGRELPRFSRGGTVGG
jgi:hypothetical protein